MGAIIRSAPRGWKHGSTLDRALRPCACFEFCGCLRYQCPVEIAEMSGGFLAGHLRMHRRGRIALLCMFRDAPQAPAGYVDIIEPREPARLPREVARSARRPNPSPVSGPGADP